MRTRQTKDLAEGRGGYRKATELDPGDWAISADWADAACKEKYPEALSLQRLADLMPDDRTAICESLRSTASCTNWTKPKIR